MLREIQGNTKGEGRQFALVVSRFNEPVTRALQAGAIEELQRAGVAEEELVIAHVPGAFEIPIVAQKFAETGHYAGVICLGALIRGQTPHFDHLAAQVTAALQQVALGTRVPVTFGVLTTDTPEQAYDRCGGSRGNKGAEAALAALEMANLFVQMEADLSA